MIDGVLGLLHGRLIVPLNYARRHRGRTAVHEMTGSDVENSNFI